MSSSTTVFVDAAGDHLVPLLVLTAILGDPAPFVINVQLVDQLQVLRSLHLRALLPRPHALEAGAVDVAHLMLVELCLVDGDDEGRPGPALQYLSPPAILCVEKLKPVLEQRQVRLSNDHDIVVLQVELLVVHLIERLAVKFAVEEVAWAHLLHCAAALGALAKFEGAVADYQYVLILLDAQQIEECRDKILQVVSLVWDVDKQLARWESVRQLVAHVREVIEQVLVLRSLILLLLWSLIERLLQLHELLEVRLLVRPALTDVDHFAITEAAGRQSLEEVLGLLQREHVRQAHHLVVQQALLADHPQGVVQSPLLLMHLYVLFVELIQRVVQAFIERLPLLLDVRAAILNLLDSVLNFFVHLLLEGSQLPHVLLSRSAQLPLQPFLEGLILFLQSLLHPLLGQLTQLLHTIEAARADR